MPTNYAIFYKVYFQLLYSFIIHSFTIHLLITHLFLKHKCDENVNAWKIEVS